LMLLRVGLTAQGPNVLRVGLTAQLVVISPLLMLPAAMETLLMETLLLRLIVLLEAFQMLLLPLLGHDVLLVGHDVLLRVVLVLPDLWWASPLLADPFHAHRLLLQPPSTNRARYTPSCGRCGSVGCPRLHGCTLNIAQESSFWIEKPFFSGTERGLKDIQLFHLHAT
jgi:hypothetical protein